MSSIITLFSSARRHGNTGKLIDNIAQNIDMEVIDLDKANIAPFDYDNKNKDDDFLPLIEKVLNHDHIIFASPVYWYSVSPGMKIFLDRISDLLIFPELLDTGRKLRGKQASIVSTHYKLSPTFNNMLLETFGYLGMHYFDALHINCQNGWDYEKNKTDIASFSNKLHRLYNSKI
ncbi:MAG: flavodoxin family protein [Cellvibrionaceae bacterium]